MNIKKSVLVIEDDFSIRQALKELLEYDHYNVVTAVNGRDGLDKLYQMPAPDLILLDLMMPIMNGKCFLKAMRADPKLAPVPVVVVSAIADDVNTFGATAYLKKPTDLDQLMNLVEKYTQLH
ncbi:MAG: response regulator [Bdellovibrionales bacterium]|nr:response regulator [Oligoflexia bacterium]